MYENDEVDYMVSQINRDQSYNWLHKMFQINHLFYILTIIVKVDTISWHYEIIRASYEFPLYFLAHSLDHFYFRPAVRAPF